MSAPREAEVKARAFRIAAAVPDPEIPAVTIEDLGILRGIDLDEGILTVRLSPTYSGCPAVLAIELAVGAALEAAGIAARIERVLAPPWTTDWITPEGREKLRTAGIAPPVTGSGALFTQTVVPCPRCGATSTEKLGDFGSTPCKAPWRCTACAEPFEHFKCL